MVWGKCEANGTCVCNTGYAINPTSGKCTDGNCSGSYMACGCGCCGGTAAVPTCYYPGAGDSLSTIMANDQTASHSSSCATVGCSQGQQYLCCTAAAQESSIAAQYSATYMVSDLQDRITLTKTGTNGTCATFSIGTPVPAGSTTKFPVTTPSQWNVSGYPAGGTCSDGGTGNRAIGALGSVTLVPSGSTCTLTAHMTLFFAVDASSPVTTIRIDTDALPIAGGLPKLYCPQ